MGSSYGGFGGGNDAIWPHQLWLSSHDNCSPITISYGGKDYQIDSYCAVQELSSAGNYGSFGTICHEYTHCFGFPDFYSNSAQDIRNWDLMDYGNNNDGGFTPCGYSAHEKMLMNWLTPIELTSAASITGMEACSDKPQAYLIRNDGHANEYYIVENRQQEGWDKGQPGKGIVVFRIDFDPNIWTGINSEYPNSYQKRRYSIFPANNSFYFSVSHGWPYPYGNNNELTNESSPTAYLNNANSDGTYLMSKPLTNMTVTDGKASFDFMGGTTAIDKIINSTQQQEYTILHQIGPVSIVRYADGTVNKIINSNY